MIHFSIRVRSPQRWDAVAETLGFKKEVVVEAEVIDIETGEVITPAVTELVFKDQTDGVHIDEIDTVWLSPPTYDAEGNQLTPGAQAPGRHFNIIIDDAVFEATFDGFWQEDENGELKLRPPGSTQAVANKSETAWRFGGAEFVDMTTVATPQRVWL